MTAGVQGEIDYVRNPAHRWCHFRDMTPEEVLVFVTHDSDPARPHRVAHVAFRTAVDQPELAMEQALAALGIPAEKEAL